MMEDGSPGVESTLLAPPTAATRDLLPSTPGSTLAFGERLPSARPTSGSDGRLGRYFILGQLGAGGMGVVLAAYDPELDRKVAIKLLKHRSGSPRDAQARLWREAQALAKLDHPNVVKVFDVGEHDQRLFVTMEFVTGGTLREWLAEQPRSWSQLLPVFIAAGQGLAAAHEAGLVHRDFKPDNLMIAEDGQVRVMDFGVARGELEREPGVQDEQLEFLRQSSSQHALRQLVTRAGALVGTPAYMAPEQLDCAPADARSDQFGFCVTLWEALYGQRPFEASNLQQLRAAIAESRVNPARDSSAPAWLRAIVLRGLAEDPTQRWPSMRALVEALADDPLTRRRKWWLAAGLAGLLGVGLSMQLSHADPPSPCTDMAQGLEGVWDDARRARLHDAVLGTGLSYAEQTSTRIRSGLDRYTSAWVEARVEACEASERGQQSDELLDRRMLCLDDRLTDLDALIAELEDSDASVVERAVEALASLPPLARCADAEALIAAVPPPEDPELAARVTELEADLSEARAKQAAGRYAPGLALVGAVVEDPVALAYPPLRARAWLEQGHTLRLLSKHEQAEQALVHALQTALTQRMQPEAAEAAAALIYVVGVGLARSKEARALASVAEALAHATESERAHANYLDSFGHVAGYDGDFDEARSSFERALELREQGSEGDSLALSSSLSGLALVASQQGEFELAERVYLRTLAIRIDAQGSEHPAVAATLASLGVVTRELGRLEQSRDYHERALALDRAAFGPAHPSVAKDLDDLSVVELALGQVESARAHLERALEIREAELGPMHSDLADSLLNLGNIAHQQGEFAAARGYQMRALAIFEAVHGPEHPSVGITRLNLGNAYKNEGEFEAARFELARSLAVLEATLGPEHGHLAYPATSLGEVLVELGRADEALEPLERALTSRVAKPGDPAELNRTRFILARALWEAPAQAGQDRGRARELAVQARDGFELLEHTELFERVETWLTELAASPD